MPPTSAAMLTASPRSGQWRWSLHLAALTWLVAVLGWLYWPAIAAAVRVWVVSPTFSHCFLIIPISAWLIWRDRMALRETAPSVYPLPLLAIPPLTVIWLAGVLVSINEIQQFALLGIFQLIALSILGRSVYSVISFPCLFLFSMIPTGEYLIGPLQEFTSWFIGAGLDGLHIANYREGSIIELTNGRFEVAEACAGLRFLIATITLGVLFAASMFRRWVKITVFIVACTVVPVIANGFRALGIVLLAHFTDNRLAVGADHLVYGWGFSVVILLVLFVVGHAFEMRNSRVSPSGRPWVARN